MDFLFFCSWWPAEEKHLLACYLTIFVPNLFSKLFGLNRRESAWWLFFSKFKFLITQSGAAAQAAMALQNNPRASSTLISQHLPQSLQQAQVIRLPQVCWFKFTDNLVVGVLNPSPEVPGSNLLCGYKVNWVFYLSDMDQMCTTKSWDLVALYLALESWTLPRKRCLGVRFFSWGFVFTVSLQNEMLEAKVVSNWIRWTGS